MSKDKKGCLVGGIPQMRANNAQRPSSLPSLADLLGYFNTSKDYAMVNPPDAWHPAMQLSLTGSDVRHFGDVTALESGEDL